MKLKKISIILLTLILLSACSGSGEVTNPEPKTAVATEKPTQETYSLEVMANPGDGGQVLPGDGEYTANSEVILNAIPSKGYAFDHWSGDYSGTGNSVVITMDSDMVIIANFSQLPTATPLPTPTATPIPCYKPGEITPDHKGQLIEVCGEVTNWGAVPCLNCPLGGYSFLKLDSQFLIISYDWVFNNEWIGDCLIMGDTVEILGIAPVFVFGKGEGYAGSECTFNDDGSMTCGGGGYFLMYDGCESDGE